MKLRAFASVPRTARVCRHSVLLIRFISLSFLALDAAALATDYPLWWGQRGVLKTPPPGQAVAADDYAALNQGQLKNMASAARDQFSDYLPGGAGATVDALVNGWANQTTANDFSPCNTGQLKAVAKPFWDRLIAENRASTYPWTSTTTDDDSSAVADLGQLKRLFDFDPVGGYQQGAPVGNLATTFPEPSGLARPTLLANQNYLWFEQDSGGPNTITAIDKGTAATAGSWTLQGVSQIDAEDLTSTQVGGVSYIFFCDVGNNANSSNSRGAGIDLRIYRCIEPTITGSAGTIPSSNIAAIDCVYPAANLPGHRDCECVFADPNSGDLYFITKRVFPALIYKLPFAATYSGTQTLAYIGKLACDTSATSTTIGTGTRTFATDSSLTFPLGARVRIASRASTANFMEGDVIAQTTGSLTVFIDSLGTIASTGGSGTFSDWDITLSNSYTRSGNNGCVTGGTMNPNGREIVLVNYSATLGWRRNNSESIGTALSRAPELLTGDVPGGIHYSHNSPAFPQREAVDFGYDGRDLYSISEFASAEGTINPLIRYSRLNQRAVTARLQQGLNNYAGCTDTYLASAAPSADNGTANPIIADIDFATATTFSAVASALAGTMIDLTVPSSTSFAAGLGARVSGSTVAAYNGTWEVDSIPSGTVVRLKKAFSATATGTIQAHTQDRQVLLKFDLGSIPAGATITDAKLRIYISGEGKGFWVNRMLSAWAAESTFASMSGGVVTDGVEATAIPDAAIAPSALDAYVGHFTVNVPPSTIQAWLDGTLANNGWVILGHPDDLTADGIQMESAESGILQRKPMLIISYTQ